jgi:hypothetical protein
VTAMQKATAPNSPASWASRQYSATKAINIRGKVMAYAALNSRNAGFSHRQLQRSARDGY